MADYVQTMSLADYWPMLRTRFRKGVPLPEEVIREVWPQSMRALMRAVELNPTDAAQYRSLASQLDEQEVPRPVRVAVLQHAAALNPGDVALQFKHANELIDEVEYQVAQPNRTQGEGHNDHVRRLRQRAVAVVRKLAQRDEGRYSPTLQCTLGMLQHNLGKQEDAEIAYGKAIMLLLGRKLKTRADANAWSGVLKEGYLPGLAASHDVPPLSEEERTLALNILHGLDCVLQKQGGAKQRRRAARVHAAGVALQLWPHALHRPREITAGRLLSCEIHRRSYYRPLVQELERATETIHAELLGLLQMVAEGKEEEAKHWYTNQEGIAARPLEWVQRHVPCQREYEMRGGLRTEVFYPARTRGICTAVTRAMGWYYGEGENEGMPQPVDRYWGVAMLSLLGPGSHVKAHTGPVNERVVFSLGLAGSLEESELRVGTARRRWQRGRAIVFDDSLEHEVRVPNSTGSGPRAVLIVHVKHPSLMPPGSNGRLLAEDEALLQSGACEEGNYGLVDWSDGSELGASLIGNQETN